MKIDSTAKSPRWLRILLGLSLALNLAVVGVAAGAAYRFSAKDHPKTGGSQSFGRMLFRDLDRQTRQSLRRDAEGGHKDFHAKRQAEAQALAAALKAKPFDVQAVEAVLTEQSATRQKFQDRVQDAWLAKVAEMSDEARADLAERLERGGKHRKFHKPKDP
ncbi:Uncharacterized membrane protein [Epibacterium ulvae]|uniref:Uncharacterized membrane protein n=1 Tax=Epibacterium ulvae TaxID=1156985 RepID=A0A1G5R4I7_9RHOB|nr:periplasmic heavy metal sensor [Epibacterium ulvae]SCZ68993.1 Uncharacterized membrane protein [Epibacterium ulvae]